ncbi:hypothetical protein [Bradyrhizobium sp. 1]|uniref:hypothetical protein n=1 Tax=Bradyrhizobium sp. 1 TaxID=241591 RepID=UPI001FFAB843|nr:hypothetical protein [Bradyrhizobium sp. 1]MCK1395839.1 hypothetical protein [Bradyrhizobium sp. 1]
MSPSSRVPSEERGFSLRSGTTRFSARVRGSRNADEKSIAHSLCCVRRFKTSVIFLIVVLEIVAPDARAACILSGQFWNHTGAVMPVAQKAVVASTSPREFIVRHLAMFAAAALFVFVLSLTYGLDLSPGFF